MRKLISIIFLAALVNIASCQSPGNGHATVKQTISVEAFQQKLDTSANVQLIDVRTPTEYEEGHLKNSVNINYNSDDLEAQLAKLDKSRPVLVYCLSGGRSSKAANKMEEMGFSEVYNMDGGIMKWNGAGKPVEKGTATPSNKGMTAEQFEKITSASGYVLVDYNAKWCEPCKKMLPMLEAFAEKRKSKVVLVKVDADDNSGLMKQKGISAIPYLELYQDGKLMWKHDGLIDGQQLEQETKL